MSFQDEVYLIADELRSIANAGAFYAGNDYDRERYERALSLSARLVAAIEERPADDVMEESLVTNVGCRWHSSSRAASCPCPTSTQRRRARQGAAVSAAPKSDHSAFRDKRSNWAV